MMTRLSVMRQPRNTLVLGVRRSILPLDLTLPGTIVASLLLVLHSSLTSRIVPTEALVLRLALLLVLELELWRRTMLSALRMTELALPALAMTPRATILLEHPLEILLLRPTSSRALTEITASPRVPQLV
jgi:hypothetical protein